MLQKKEDLKFTYIKYEPTPLIIIFPKNDIISILFLSKSLNGAELRYWPTELEVAGLVWTVRKIRHLIDSSPLPAVVFTDHSAIADIFKQSTLTSSSVDKLNLRLVRASQYLSQFDLDVRHKPGNRIVRLLPLTASTMTPSTWHLRRKVGPLNRLLNTDTFFQGLMPSSRRVLTTAIWTPIPFLSVEHLAHTVDISIIISTARRHPSMLAPRTQH